MHANWDADAGVFTTESDIPGLVVEAESYGELVELVSALAPEVIAANAGDMDGSPKIEIVARRLIVV